MKSSQTKQAQSSFITFLIALILISGLHKHCDAQTIKECSQTLPDSVPRMWVPYLEGQAYESNYVDHQFADLSDYLKEHNLGKEEAKTVFLSIAGFKKMLEYFESLGNFKYLHVYIASYGKAGESVPPGLENKMTILFAPGTGEFTHDALGYTLTAAGDFDSKSKFCVIDLDKDPSWLIRYYDKMFAKLDDNLEDNIDNHNPDGSKTNTKFISYEYESICQLFKEFHYQETNGNKISVSGLQAFFSSYPATGRVKDKRFKNRIFVIFEFTRNVNNNNEVFYIDKQPGFEQRKKPEKREYMKNSTLGVDNGHLCPPC